jgi:hypothetical protein
MSKSALVKIGLPSEQAESMKRMRRIRQIMEQHDAAVARLDAATNERIKEIVNASDSDMPADEEPTRATA